MKDRVEATFLRLAFQSQAGPRLMMATASAFYFFHDAAHVD